MSEHGRIRAGGRDGEDPPPVRRLLVALDPVRIRTAPIEAAARLARSLGLELAGLVLELHQQVTELGRLGHHHHRADHVGQRRAATLRRGDAEDVLDVDHAGDVVEVVSGDGESGQPGALGRVEEVAGRGVGTQGGDVGPRGEGVGCGLGAEPEAPVEKLGQRSDEGAALLGGVNQPVQLVAAAHRRQLLGRFEPDEAQERVGRGVADDDDRAEQRDEQPEGHRHGERRGQRTGDRHPLGDQLADHHLDHGGQQERGDDRRGHRGPGVEGTEERFEQRRDHRFGQDAEGQAAQGDAQLGARQGERESTQDRVHSAGGSGTRLDLDRDLAAVHGDERELGRDEHGVGQDQGEHRDQTDGDAHGRDCIGGCVDVGAAGRGPVR